MSSSGNCVLGLNGTAYFNGFYPFLNIAKEASAQGGGGPALGTTSLGNINASNGGAQIAQVWSYLDDDGQIPIPASSDLNTYQVIIYAGDTQNQTASGAQATLAGEEIAVTWTNNGMDLTIFGVTATVDNTNRRATFTIPEGGGGNIVLSFTFTGAAGARNSPFRNLKAFFTKYENETVIEGVTYPGINQGGLFNPHWLHYAVKQFPRVRTMDWMSGNFGYVTDFADLVTETSWQWGTTLTSDQAYGPKGGVPLSVLVALAQQAGADLHFNIPDRITDAAMTSIVTYFRDNLTTQKVIYEYGNEHWNGSFTYWDSGYGAAQGEAVFSGVSNPSGYGYSHLYHGYRSAELMKIVRDVYNDRTRWRGALGSQTVGFVVTDAAIFAINHYLTNVLGGTLGITDLFDSVLVAPYFGGYFGYRGCSITNITNASSAVITTLEDHGLSPGDPLIIQMVASNNMGALDKVETTVSSVLSSTTFSIPVNTSNTTTYVPYANGLQWSYFLSGRELLLWQIMDMSEAKHTANASAYPTKYDYFAEQLEELMMTGACSANALTVEDAFWLQPHIDTYWPGQASRASAVGLVLEQYEGGHSFGFAPPFIYTPGRQIADGTTCSRFFEFFTRTAHSTPIGNVTDAFLKAWFAAGHDYAAIFVEGNSPGVSGFWGWVRDWPCVANPAGDFENPRWRAALAANGNFKRMRARAA